jgi:ABC-type Fe3+/spermidine/putrescine transport system ATPase subunit
MVFQNYALFPHMTVAENIAFPLKQRHIPKPERETRVTQALDLIHLSGYGNRYPRQLSGGQQQRVALARAIVFKPNLLLMDEPLGALDKQLRENLQLEMRRLHAELGITFVYVTHDQEEALTMSDRIAVMNEGRIAQLGRPEDLYDRPGSKFVASFLGESNFLQCTMQGSCGNDQIIVDCGGAMIKAFSTSRPVAGETVTLTMRPERLRFADTLSPPRDNTPPDTTSQDNRLTATITDAVFVGERCRYLLKSPDGTALVLKEPSGAGIRRRGVGETAELAWAAADTVLV